SLALAAARRRVPAADRVWYRVGADPQVRVTPGWHARSMTERTFVRVVDSWASMTGEELIARVLEDAAEQSAHHAMWLSALAEVDRRELRGEAGVRSLAHWLELRAGMDGRTAREHVRVMRRLEELTRVRDVYASGRLSYSKVRALCRVA